MGCNTGLEGLLSRKLKLGNVLPLVLGVLLVLSILMTVLLRLPGTLRRTVAFVANETQNMYLAESAVIAKLEGFPDGYFAELLTVESRLLGPWNLWHVNVPYNRGSVRPLERETIKFQFLLGNEFEHFSTSEWTRCAVALEQNLHERILQSEGIKSVSGNHRIFKFDSTLMGRASLVALNVGAGDLTLDLGGSDAFSRSGDGRASLRSFMANVEGDVKVRGNVHFDTLRIYSTESVLLQGNVSADFVEIFGLVGVTISGDVSLAGLLLSKQNVEISGNAKMKFPSVAIVVGARGNRLSLFGKSVFEGAMLAPSGVVDRDSSAVLLDSTKALLPFCMDSRPVVFSRRRL